MIIDAQVQVRPEGESGKLEGRYTEARLEALSEYWGIPEAERKLRNLDVEKVASLLGISPASVRVAQRDKRVRERIEERLRDELLYDVIEARAVAREILHNPKEKADTRLKAWGRIEQLAGNINAGNNGPSSIHITNDYSTYEGMSVAELRAEGRRLFSRDADGGTAETP